jgi:pilus assembly protein Flp/PilA
MAKLIRIATVSKIWKDTQGQELVEYALLGAFVACAYGAVAPGVATDVIAVLGKVLASLSLAGGGGSSLSGGTS